MSILPLHDCDRNMPEPQGHLIGFVESHSAFVEMFRALSDLGFSDSEFLVLCGDDGMHLLKRMLGNPLFGPTANGVMKQGIDELGRGQCAIIIDIEDRERALAAVEACVPLGGHSFTYFGVVVDEKLTV